MLIYDFPFFPLCRTFSSLAVPSVPSCSLSLASFTRLSFIALSVRHLFRTSYDARAGDELTAMALVNYLNAALPMDKHEEFDLPEVTKAVAGALKERGIVKLEGDVVRLIG